MFHLHHYSHHPVHCFSEGSKMITWRCYYPSSNFHKQVWLTANCPHGRLDLKQENSEQNITWLVIREKTSLGRASASWYVLYCSDLQHAQTSLINSTWSLDGSTCQICTVHEKEKVLTSNVRKALVTLASITIIQPWGKSGNIYFSFYLYIEVHVMVIFIIN